MKRVEVPLEFFRKERQAYNDWKVAFWREMLQNSIDAGAFEFRVNVKSHGDGVYEITIFDDGCGMTPEVLDDVFFALGRSTKDGKSSIGGFGRARMLTCFSFTRYQIRTGTSYVDGSGSEYTHTTGQEKVKGTTFTITFNEKADGTDIESFIDAINDLLLHSRVDLEITVDGNSLKRIKTVEAFVRDLKLGDKPFAKVYSGADAGFCQVYTRIKGLWTMENWVPDLVKNIYIELVPEVSFKALTSNRDGFASPYKEIFDQFIGSLVTDGLSSKPRKVTTYLKGKGAFYFTKEGGRPFTGESMGRMARELATRKQLETAVAVLNAAVENSSQPEKRKVYQVSEFLPDVPLIVEHWHPDIEKVVERYDPRNWKFEVRGNDLHWKGNHQEVALYFAWCTSLSFAVKALCDMRNFTNFHWVAGWHFSSRAQASATYENIGGGIFHEFYLNPVDDKLQHAYDLRSKKSAMKLIASAMHEVCHAISSTHGERFASTLTDLIEEVPYDEVSKAIFRTRI